MAMTIRKTKEGYEVLSEHGKHLSKTNLSKGQAKKRLEQVEYLQSIKARKNKEIKMSVEKGHFNYGVPGLVTDDSCPKTATQNKSDGKEAHKVHNKVPPKTPKAER
jgi:hypothetical protein